MRCDVRMLRALMARPEFNRRQIATADASVVRALGVAVGLPASDLDEALLHARELPAAGEWKDTDPHEGACRALRENSEAFRKLERTYIETRLGPPSDDDEYQAEVLSWVMVDETDPDTEEQFVREQARGLANWRAGEQRKVLNGVVALAVGRTAARAAGRVLIFRRYPIGRRFRRRPRIARRPARNAARAPDRPSPAQPGRPDADQVVPGSYVCPVSSRQADGRGGRHRWSCLRRERDHLCVARGLDPLCGGTCVR